LYFPADNLRNFVGMTSLTLMEADAP